MNIQNFNAKVNAESSSGISSIQRFLHQQLESKIEELNGHFSHNSTPLPASHLESFHLQIEQLSQTINRLLICIYTEHIWWNNKGLFTAIQLDLLNIFCEDEQLLYLLRIWSRRFDFWCMSEEEQRLRIILKELQQLKLQLRLQYAAGLKRTIELESVGNHSAQVERLVKEELFLVLMCSRASLLCDSLDLSEGEQQHSFVVKGKILRELSWDKIEVIVNDHRQHASSKTLIGDILMLADDLGLSQ